MIIELYPNVEKFGLEHSDDYVMFVACTEEQATIFATIDWIISNQIIAKFDVNSLEGFIDRDISNDGIGAAYGVVSELLSTMEQANA